MQANDGGFRSDYREGMISGHKRWSGRGVCALDTCIAKTKELIKQFYVFPRS